MKVAFLIFLCFGLTVDASLIQFKLFRDYKRNADYVKTFTIYPENACQNLVDYNDTASSFQVFENDCIEVFDLDECQGARRMLKNNCTDYPSDKYCCDDGEYGTCNFNDKASSYKACELSPSYMKSTILPTTTTTTTSTRAPLQNVTSMESIILPITTTTSTRAPLQNVTSLPPIIETYQKESNSAILNFVSFSFIAIIMPLL